MEKQRLVLLDFDGTLTRSDTLLDFIRFYHGTFLFIMGFSLLSPVLVAMKLKLMKNDRVKEIVLRYFFGNEPVDHFNERCEEFATHSIPALIKPSAIQLLNTERSLNSRLIVVSASPENWVRPWCEKQNLECLATGLEVASEQITGNIKGKNCYGAEKVVRIKELLSLNDYHPIVAYGDSRGDREMLALAQEAFYRKL